MLKEGKILSKVTEIVEEMVHPILDELHLELVDVEYVKEGPNWFLRVYIDKDTGVDIDECAVVSEKLSEKLDEVDPISENYFLEVSSPGAERPLKKTKTLKKRLEKMSILKHMNRLKRKKHSKES